MIAITVEPLLTDTSLMRTPLHKGQQNLDPQFFYIIVYHILNEGHLPIVDRFFGPVGVHIREVPLVLFY